MANPELLGAPNVEINKLKQELRRLKGRRCGNNIGAGVLATITAGSGFSESRRHWKNTERPQINERIKEIEERLRDYVLKR